VAARHLPPIDAEAAERPWLALAWSLYQGAMGLPTAAVEQGRELVRTALAPLRQAKRNRVAVWWRQWREDAHKQTPSSLAEGKEGRRRAELLRRSEVLGALISA
jgi:hypothetical protein